MDIHQNARLTPHGRAELVRRVLVRGQTPKAVAGALGVTVKTVNKWCERFQAEGASGLLERSSRPHRLRQPTPDTTVERIAARRREAPILKVASSPDFSLDALERAMAEAAEIH